MFFDELGPPWPKHACTDRSRDSSVKGQTWAAAGWHAMTDLKIAPIGDRGLSKIVGHDAGHAHSFYCRTVSDLDLHIVRFRRLGGGGSSNSRRLLAFRERASGSSQVEALGRRSYRRRIPD